MASEIFYISYTNQKIFKWDVKVFEVQVLLYCAMKYIRKMWLGQVYPTDFYTVKYGNTITSVHLLSKII